MYLSFRDSGWGHWGFISDAKLHEQSKMLNDNDIVYVSG